jgi:hypothetical protein
MVVQPRPLATRHDLVGVGARQVNDVGRVGTEHPAQRWSGATVTPYS